jgi:hypothetical protein
MIHLLNLGISNLGGLTKVRDPYAELWFYTYLPWAEASSPWLNENTF